MDQAIISKLTEKGYRLTPQRMMIISAIENSADHISAEEIYTQIAARYPQVNISTVYRTLDLLKQLGLVTETDMGSGHFRYHPGDKGRHHHLVCQECGKVIDLDEVALAPLQDTILRRYNFIAEMNHLAITGRCAACRQ